MSTRQKAIVILWVSVVLIGLLAATSQANSLYSTTTQDDTEILQEASCTPIDEDVLSSSDAVGGQIGIDAVKFVKVGGEPVVANTWPHYLHDPAHTGYNPGENTLRPPLEFKWKAKPDGYFLYSHPIATGDSVFATFTSDAGQAKICRLNKYDGSEVWPGCRMIDFASSYSEPAMAMDDGFIYVATENKLYALSVVDGSDRWNPVNFTGSLRGTVVDGNSIYVIEESGSYPNYVSTVYVLDKQNGGTPQSIYAINSQYFLSYMQPIIVNDALIFSLTCGEGEPGLVAIHKTTGRDLWNVMDPYIGPSFLTGNVPDNLVYVLLGNDPDLTVKLKALNASSGAEVWPNPYEYGPDYVDSIAPVLANGKLYQIQTKWNGVNVVAYLNVFDAATGGLLHQFSIPDPDVGNYVSYEFMSMANGVIYAGHNAYPNKYPLIRAFDVATGVLLWESDEEGDNVHSIVIGGGLIYVDGGDRYGNDVPPTAGYLMAYEGLSADTPDIDVSPTSHNYGEVPIGSSSSKTFNVLNRGTGDLLIGTISITGRNPSEFIKQNDNCSGQTVLPSSSCTVQVVFSPTSVGLKSAELSIPSNDPDTPQLNVPLSGIALQETSITVTIPNGFEKWEAERAYDIRWTYTGTPGSSVKIELLKGGVLNRTISKSTLIKSGLYNWTIPVSQASGNDYKIKVTSTTNRIYTDTSDNNFTIIPTSITVTVPNGGDGGGDGDGDEGWGGGKVYAIRWTYTGTPGSSLKIELLKGGRLNSTISSSTPIGSSGNGSYNWTIPSSQASGTDYKIKVTTTRGYTDKSDNNFTISNLPCKTNGEIIGELEDVILYSNGCNIEKTFWQCTEFARRFYFQHYHFSNTHYNEDYIHKWCDDGRTFVNKAGLVPIDNGKTKWLPSVGDTIAFEGGDHGHVAIVSNVIDTDTEHIISFHQQNWSSGEYISPIGSVTFTRFEGNVALDPYYAYQNQDWKVIGWGKPRYTVPKFSRDGDNYNAVFGRIGGIAEQPLYVRIERALNTDVINPINVTVGGKDPLNNDVVIGSWKVAPGMEETLTSNNTFDLIGDYRFSIRAPQVDNVVVGRELIFTLLDDPASVIIDDSEIISENRILPPNFSVGSTNNAGYDKIGHGFCKPWDFSPDSIDHDNLRGEGYLYGSIVVPADSEVYAKWRPNVEGDYSVEVFTPMLLKSDKENNNFASVHYEISPDGTNMVRSQEINQNNYENQWVRLKDEKGNTFWHFTRGGYIKLSANFNEQPDRSVRFDAAKFGHYYIYPVSERVTHERLDIVIPGVKMTFSIVAGTGALPDPTETDETGYWSQKGFEAGTIYRVTPSKSGYTFKPAYLEFQKETTTLNFVGNQGS